MKSKFNNVWTKCKQGHNHQSKREAAYCDYLELQKKAGKIHHYDTQKNFVFKINNHIVGKHKVDFYVIKEKSLVQSDDISNIEVHEVKMKSYQTNKYYKNTPAFKLWKIKKALFEALYPHIKYIVIDGEI
jgi:hypothetical protein